MELVKDKFCEKPLENCLRTSISYVDYMELVSDLVINESATGNDKSADMVHYTKLNEKRMKRWNKTLKVSDKMNQKIVDFTGDVTWLVLTESWCGDAAHLLPIMNKIASLNSAISLRTVLRDENPELMDAYLTNGGRSIPKLIMVDNTTGNVLGTYGPRPEILTKKVREYKEIHEKLTLEFKGELQVWYNKDKGQTTIKELVNFLYSY
jgi:hypothetical protein